MKLSPKSARALGCFGIAGGLLLLPPFGQAGTKTWTSAVDGVWSDNTKWSPPGAPANGEDVVISVSGPTNYTVTLDTSPTVSRLILGASSGSTLQTLFAASQTITLSGESQIDFTGVLALNGS